MGVPKQRWTSEEEAALRAGVARHGVGNWRTILKDPEFSSTLCYRSNVDLKDKWRNMNVIFNASSSREKGRTGVKKTRPTPKSNDQLMVVSTITSDADEEIVDVKPVASVSAEVWNNPNPKKSNSRLDNVILEAIKNLKEPTGSHRTTIANCIEVEAGLHEDLVWSDSDSSEEEDADFFPDHKGGPSELPTQSSVPSPPPTVSEAQVTQPSEFSGLLQQLIQQQREDRLAAEEARRASEARFAQLQHEAARDRAAADERFAGLLDRVTQRQDAQIQQMQQGMFAMFGMVQQLLSHTGLAPQQQADLQGMSALALAPTPAPALAPTSASAPGTVSSPAGISFSALFGSAGRPVFSPLPQVSLFQSPVGSTHPESTSVLPSGGVVGEQQQQTQPEQPSEQQQQCSSAQSSEQQAPPEQAVSPSFEDDDDDPSRYIVVPHLQAP